MNPAATVLLTIIEREAMTLDEARFQKAMEICRPSSGRLGAHPLRVEGAADALKAIDWQPPEDLDIAASRKTVPPYLMWRDAAAVLKQAREIALAAYKAGKAAR